ncbi:hypothetical protein ZIOFF_016387 [Zingiber officinale]|uniref:ribose-5-phosphate isomerase n=1 Tax=Zingiber officinale TaxID=94328 RepID=A0A8J5HFI7_ZINOF|nr:hypothetical protein ZIOFF_016387 [Zingiber officinale]
MGSPFLLQPSRSLTEEAMAAAGQSQDDLKRIAALRAVELVRSGMVLGLGTGSTAAHALDRIGDLLQAATRDIDGIHGDLQAISDDLLRITGVVKHGMFLGLATSVIVARKDGVVLMDKEAKSNGF